MESPEMKVRSNHLDNKKKSENINKLSEYCMQVKSTFPVDISIFMFDTKTFLSLVPFNHPVKAHHALF